MTLLDVNEFHGVIAVSAAYVVMYYVYMCAGPASHEVGASEAQQRWGRRIFGNLCVRTSSLSPKAVHGALGHGATARSMRCPFTSLMRDVLMF